MKRRASELGATDVHPDVLPHGASSSIRRHSRSRSGGLGQNQAKT
jgi:hypothetical protein